MFLDVSKRVVANRIPELLALMQTKSQESTNVALKVLSLMDKLCMAQFGEGFELFRQRLLESAETDNFSLQFHILKTLAMVGGGLCVLLRLAATHTGGDINSSNSSSYHWPK